MNNRTIIMIAMVAVVMMIGHASAEVTVLSEPAADFTNGTYKDSAVISVVTFGISQSAGETLDNVTVTVVDESVPGTVPEDFASLKVYKENGTTGFQGTDLLVGTETTVNVDSATTISTGTTEIGATETTFYVVATLAAAPGDTHQFSVDMATDGVATNASSPNVTALDGSVTAIATIDTTVPTISAVTIPNATMKVGDVVTATITVGNDSGDTYSLTSGTIGGFALGSLARTNATTYTATFTIANGGTDVAAGADIPVADLIIADSATDPSATYSTPISQAGDSIDANLPTFTETIKAKNGTTDKILITFSEGVSGGSTALDAADFVASGSDSLTIDSVAHDDGSKYATLTMSANINLTGVGELFIAAATGAILDAGDNACDQGATDVYNATTVDTAPTLTISTVPNSPSKTKTDLGYIFEFSGGVTGFTVGDITLNFAGAGAGAVNGSTFVQYDANIYYLPLDGQDKVDLAALTTGQTVVASVNMTALDDLIGNAGVGTKTNTWTYDVTAPSGGSSGGSSGTYPPGWFGTPTATVTATTASTPSATETATVAPPGDKVTPAPTKKPDAVATTPAAEGTTAGAAKEDTPGFTAIVVIAGVLAVAYLVMRRRE